MDNKYIPKKGDWIMWVSGGKPLIAEVLMFRKQDHYPWKIEWVTTEGITSNFLEVRMSVEELGINNIADTRYE